MAWLDPFGNYLCQKLFGYCGEEQKTRIARKVAPGLVAVSLNMHGTRSVQKLIDCLGMAEQVGIVRSDSGHRRCPLRLTWLRRRACAEMAGSDARARAHTQVNIVVTALKNNVVTLIKVRPRAVEFCRPGSGKLARSLVRPADMLTLQGREGRRAVRRRSSPGP